jgi:hypothetical protein
MSNLDELDPSEDDVQVGEIDEPEDDLLEDLLADVEDSEEETEEDTEGED